MGYFMIDVWIYHSSCCLAWPSVSCSVTSKSSQSRKASFPVNLYSRVWDSEKITASPFKRVLMTALERCVYLPTVLSEWENIASVFYAGHAILILMPRGENLILKAQIVNNVTQDFFFSSWRKWQTLFTGKHRCFYCKGRHIKKSWMVFSMLLL